MRKSVKLNRRHFVNASLALVAGGLGAKSLGASESVSPLKGKRVLIAIGEFSEALETYYMIFRLREDGALPIVASPTVKRLQLVVHDFEPAYEGYTEKLGYQVDSAIAYQDIDPSGYQGLLIPGGRGPEEIRQNPYLVKLVGHFLDKKLPTGAMCHGVMLLYTARPIRGRRLTAYSGIRADIEALGGKFIDEEVVVDGSMVTSRGWPDLAGFMREFLRLLKKS